LLVFSLMKKITQTLYVSYHHTPEKL